MLAKFCDNQVRSIEINLNLDSGINVSSPTFINFWDFFNGLCPYYSGLRLLFFVGLSSVTFFLLAIYRKIWGNLIICNLRKGATVIQGYMFIVFAKFPGAMFIPGAASIPESRGLDKSKKIAWHIFSDWFKWVFSKLANFKNKNFAQQCSFQKICTYSF